MTRRLFATLSAFSLAMFVVICVLWTTSYLLPFEVDRTRYETAQNVAVEAWPARYSSVGVLAGCVWIQWGEIERSSYRLTKTVAAKWEIRKASDVNPGGWDDPDMHTGKFGFEYGYTSHMSDHRAMRVPVWPFTFLAALLPSVWLYTKRRIRAIRGFPASAPNP